MKAAFPLVELDDTQAEAMAAVASALRPVEPLVGVTILTNLLCCALVSLQVPRKVVHEVVDGVLDGLEAMATGSGGKA